MTSRVGDILALVRQKLQADGIKLWLQPYHIDGLGICDEEIASLANKFAVALGIAADRCRMALVELQHHAIDKLHANQTFAAHGIATLKVRTPVNNTNHGGARTLTVNTPLTVTGREFHLLLADRLQTSAGNFRVIAAGKFVHDLQTLEAQGIRNHHQVMAVIMATPVPPIGSPQSSEPDGAVGGSEVGDTDETIYQKIARARADAELLTDQKGYLEMEDQTGKTVHLPPAERRSIVLALALHEKGKAALRRDLFSESLVWLLEADAEYGHCNSSLLQSVDNWALLNLDIVWCYLCLKSVAQLPEADKRLQICERSFKQTYGENMHRVLAVKGNATNERALILRLHLLQAVILFHQQRPTEAATLLLRAENELSSLRICETTLGALVEMGYGIREARLALRASRNNIDDALTYIFKQREERAEARRLNRAELQLQVGRSRDKRWVNPRSLHMLIDQGFEKRLCEAALRRADNDLERAVQLLQQQPLELQRQWEADFLPDAATADAMVAMGFERALVETALRIADNRMDRAMEVIVCLQVDAATYSEESARSLEALMSNAGTTSSTSNATEEAAQKMRERAAQKLERRMVADEALGRLAEDLDEADDDHLDLPLEQETNVLAEYKRYLNM